MSQAAMNEQALEVEINYLEDKRGHPSQNDDHVENPDEFEIFSEFDWEDEDEYQQSSAMVEDGKAFEPPVVSDGNAPKVQQKSRSQDGKPRRAKRRRGKIQPSDVRLRMMSDYVNIMNAADPDRFWEFLQARDTPDILHIERYLEEVPDVCMYREFRGYEQIHKFACANWEAIPDMTFKLVTCKLFVRSNERSYLVSTMEVTGSWLFAIKTVNYEKKSKNFMSKWNPFTRLYKFIVKGSSNQSPESSSQNGEEDATKPTSSATLNKASLQDSSKVEVFPSSKAVRGKANPAVPTIKISADSIKVSTASTEFDTSQRKDQPFKLNISLTMIVFLNEDLLCYRSEVIKRATASFDVEAYLNSTFDDDGNTVIESMEVVET